MGYHKLSLRVLALSCWFLARPDMHLAIALYLHSVPEEDSTAVHDIRKFMLNNYTKFMETGSVANRPHPARDKKVPDDVAMECSKALKKGYYAEQPDISEGDQHTRIHLWYTSIEHACVKDPLLASVCKDYQVSPKNLLRRLYEVDPNLTLRHLDFKMELSAQQKANRKSIAGQLYDLWRNIPNFLESIFWIDEVTFWFCPHYSKHNIKVYCDAHDAEVREVFHSPLLRTKIKKGEKIQVRALCAVNMLLGPFFLEFTTGTTDIQRRHVRAPAGGYKVGGKNQMVPSVSVIAMHPSILPNCGVYDHEMLPWLQPTIANEGLNTMNGPCLAMHLCTYSADASISA